MNKLIKSFGLLCTVILSSCGIIKPVTVTSVGNFKTVNPMSRPEIHFDVGLMNPNNYSVTIEKMDIGISMGGSLLAEVILLEGVSITKKESILVPVSLVPSTKDISSFFKLGVDAFLSGKKEQHLEIGGEVIIKKLFFKRRYTIKESISF